MSLLMLEESVNFQLAEGAVDEMIADNAAFELSTVLNGLEEMVALLAGDLPTGTLLTESTDEAQADVAEVSGKLAGITSKLGALKTKIAGLVNSKESRAATFKSVAKEVAGFVTLVATMAGGYVAGSAAGGVIGGAKHIGVKSAATLGSKLGVSDIKKLGGKKVALIAGCSWLVLRIASAILAYRKRSKAVPGEGAALEGALTDLESAVDHVPEPLKPRFQGLRTKLAAIKAKFKKVEAPAETAAE